VLQLVVFADSYILAGRIPTPPSPHSLNIFQVRELDCIYVIIHCTAEFAENGALAVWNSIPDISAVLKVHQWQHY
jgi:hypothetical protein